MAQKDDTTPEPAAESAAADSTSTASAAAPAAKRSGVPKALAITGIAVGSALLLGLTFAGGTALGRALPDGPGGHGGESSASAEAPDGERGEIAERIGDRMDQRAENRDQRAEMRDDRRAQFEQWLEEQGIDPSTIPAPLAPPAP
ncbi:MAG: hypothetical protein RL499_1470 [Actinomycetota bacterium]